MCEANAYVSKDGQEELLLEAVDVIEPIEEGEYRLISIYGEQKTIKGKIILMNLVDHKIIFKTLTP
ncbi:MAG: CooT family nickel-binding protein [Thermodesulfobacteriota bacterium]|nr:CooT family nickel-binding protein [Thermodesulfobacteriota bacterium]